MRGLKTVLAKSVLFCVTAQKAWVSVDNYRSGTIFRAPVRKSGRRFCARNKELVATVSLIKRPQICLDQMAIS